MFFLLLIILCMIAYRMISRIKNKKEKSMVSKPVVVPEKDTITVMQWFYGFQNYFDLSIKINRAYCKAHGYNYIVDNSTPYTDGRHTNWGKLKALARAMEVSDSKYIVCIDGDAWFYTKELSIENEALPLLGDKMILLSADCGCERERWHPSLPINAFLLYRNCEEMKTLIKKWEVAHLKDPDSKTVWPLEQRAFWNVILPEYIAQVVIEPDYYRLQGKYSYFVRHAYRQSDKERCRLMSEFIESRKGDWNFE